MSKNFDETLVSAQEIRKVFRAMPAPKTVFCRLRPNVRGAISRGRSTGQKVDTRLELPQPPARRR